MKTGTRSLRFLVLGLSLLILASPFVVSFAYVMISGYRENRSAALFERISVGMSREDVLHLLGEPSSIFTAKELRLNSIKYGNPYDKYTIPGFPKMAYSGNEDASVYLYIKGIHTLKVLISSDGTVLAKAEAAPG